MPCGISEKKYVAAWKYPDVSRYKKAHRRRNEEL